MPTRRKNASVSAVIDALQGRRRFASSPLKGARSFLVAAAALSFAGCTGAVFEGQLRPNPTGSGEVEEPGGHGDPSGPSLSGAALWADQCASCHGRFSTGSAISTGNTNGDFRLDAELAVQKHANELESYIARTMPFGSADRCVGDCAQQMGTFIRARQQPVNQETCKDFQGPSYGRRELKLLSSQEYQNALEDLLGLSGDFGDSVANNDGDLGGFINMRGQAVNGSLLDTYLSNAETIARWAVDNGQPFTCSGAAAACAQRFADEFLFRAFRGPVSEGQRAAFTRLFETNGNDGLRLAIETALASPYFLYRIEAGVDLETALDAGFYTNTSAPAGEATEYITAADFPHYPGRREGDVHALLENGGIEIRFSTPFTEPTIIEVQARGSNHDMVWPQLTVRVDGNQIGVQTIDSRELRNYRFEVSGVTGTPAVRLEFNNDSGVPPYGPGQDANIYFARVGLITVSAETTTPTPGRTNPLEGVASDAFVLTPFEFASTLSFMLTGSTPDRQLLQAAQRDQLTTEAQVRAQVVRLIDSPRGRKHFKDFVTEWFELDAVEKAARPDVPEFTPAVKEAMVQEVEEHFAHIFYDDGVPFSEFFSGNYTFLNRTLAQFYGIPGNFDDRWVRTTVENRGGPIASGAFMTANAHVERSAPILRAVRAREAALCHHIDPPNSPIAGENIDEQRAAAQMAVTQREQAEGALSSRDFFFLYTDGIDACAGCHERVINPLFGMEDFDQVGRLRPSAGTDAVMETVHGLDRTVSLQGTLYGVDSTSDPTTIEFAGAKDFSNKIAETKAVQRCLIRRGFRFVTGLTFSDRDLDTGKQEDLTMEQRLAYGCIASRLEEVLETTNESPRAMVIELAMQSLLRLRR